MCPSSFQHGTYLGLMIFSLFLWSLKIGAQHVAPFTKITTGPVVTDEGISFGLAWGDYDEDGYLDLFVTNIPEAGASSTVNFLYHNLGGGQFNRIMEGPIATLPGISQGCAWADFDNDGRLDLYVGNLPPDDAIPNVNFLYRNLGQGQFDLITKGDTITAAPFTYAVCWGDYDNDGHVDLFLVSSAIYEQNNTRNTLLKNNGDGSFTAVTSGCLVTDGIRRAQTAAWGDYNNDGRLDLIVAAVLEKWLYQDKGNGTFVRISNALAQDKNNTVSADWGDYDNDGWLDFFGAAFDPPYNYLFHNKGNGQFTKVTLGPCANSWSGSWADYDNDGYLDLLVVQGEGNSHLLYHNNGNGTFTKITQGSLVQEPGYAVGLAWGDYDNDGFMDLVISNGSGTSKKNNLYHNDGNSTNHWLMFKLVGTTSNRSAIGAKVRVKATIGGKTYWQLREISGGRFSQNDLRPHFGLGDASNAALVRIEWPSGIVQELPNVAAGQILTVTEPIQLQSQAAGSFQFRSWKNMVFEVECSPDCTSWSSLATVTNLTGTVKFTDPEAPQHAVRFYRVKSK